MKLERHWGGSRFHSGALGKQGHPGPPSRGWGGGLLPGALTEPKTRFTSAFQRLYESGNERARAHPRQLTLHPRRTGSSPVQSARLPEFPARLNGGSA